MHFQLRDSTHTVRSNVRRDLNVDCFSVSQWNWFTRILMFSSVIFYIYQFMSFI